jgi:hypothetical protein
VPKLEAAAAAAAVVVKLEDEIAELSFLKARDVIGPMLSLKKICCLQRVRLLRALA